MSAEENKKLLEYIFDQMAGGNGRALSDAMVDDFRWVVPGNWSWSGTWETKTSALTEMLLPLMSQFEGDYRTEVDFVLADGDRVVVQSRGYATTKRGDAYNQTYCYIFRVADGRLTEVVEYCDTALADRVLEPPVRPLGAGVRT